MKLFLISCLLLPLIVFAEAEHPNQVANVIILKGSALAQDPENKSIHELKLGDWLKEGAVIQTKEASLVKILFIDKSQMTLGPSSKMTITKFDRSNPGIISLMKGQLRSTVSKDYMNVDQNGSKLFVKTKTAAMGVRSTDFKVIYNSENKNTALLTFSGAVAMAKIDSDFSITRVDTKQLDRILSSDSAVLVTKGKFAGVSPEENRPNKPITISPAQLETLKKADENPLEASNQDSKKSFRSTVPPGVDAKSFANVKVEDVKVKAESDVPPEGFVNKTTGEKAPPAGGYIDPQTALYIPPPPGSAFDPNTQTYTPPASYGGFDPKSGAYVPPTGFVLTAKGEFVADQTRAPASGDSTPTVAPKIIEGPMVPTGSSLPEGTAPLNPVPQFEDPRPKDNLPPPPTTNESSRVRFIFHNQ